MKKTSQPPADPPTDNTAKKRKIRSVLFTDERWKVLRATGNANHAINRILTEAGIAE